jgi:polyferredoxin
MDKQEFRVMSFYVLSIGILSLVMSLVAPPMVSQVLLFMVSSAGLLMWGLYAMFTKDERR